MKNKVISLFFIATIFAAGIGLSYWALRPPTPPSKNDLDYSTYNQMLANIEAMTQYPHPSGSMELADVRAYLLAQLDEMCVEYTVLETVCSLEEITVANKKRQSTISGDWEQEQEQLQGGVAIPVEVEQEHDFRNEAVFDENDNLTLYNILVKIDAPDTDNGVLFIAHYDSEFGVPGACDDMTGVCALLETVRRHANIGNLQNDLYFLFTDGEELGAMGSAVFVRDNPAFTNIIDLVVNMDARGTSGGLLMFESNMFDLDELALFKAASSKPIAYSWMPMLYRNMSNGTDLTSFLEAGYSGLNFAVAEGVENYSSPTDDIDHLDRGTAYNFMRTAFELSDHVAMASLGSNNGTQDGVYFTLFPNYLILMSGSIARILSAFAVLATLAWLIWNWRTRSISVPRVLLALGSHLCIVVTSALFAQGISMLIQKAKLFRLAEDDMFMNIPAFLCMTTVIGASAFVASVLVNRKRTLDEIIAGILLLFVPLSLASTIFFNAMSYFFTLPLLGLLALALFRKCSIPKIIAAVLAGIFILLLYTPICWLLYIMLGFEIYPLVIVIATIPITIIGMLFLKVRTS